MQHDHRWSVEESTLPALAPKIPIHGSEAVAATAVIATAGTHLEQPQPPSPARRRPPPQRRPAPVDHGLADVPGTQAVNVREEIADDSGVAEGTATAAEPLQMLQPRAEPGEEAGLPGVELEAMRSEVI